MTEAQHQAMVMKWSQQPEIRSRWPELALLYHIPNGGTRDVIEGRQQKSAVSSGPGTEQSARRSLSASWRSSMRCSTKTPRWPKQQLGKTPARKMQSGFATCWMGWRSTDQRKPHIVKVNSQTFVNLEVLQNDSERVS